MQEQMLLILDCHSVFNVRPIMLLHFSGVAYKRSANFTDDIIHVVLNLLASHVG